MVSATNAGSSPNPSSRSAETGTSTAAATVAAWTMASSRVTEPSRRPVVPAKPLLVVARAEKPIEARSRADPASHGYGINNTSGPWWRARKRSHFSCCVGIGRACQDRPPDPVRIRLWQASREREVEPLEAAQVDAAVVLGVAGGGEAGEPLHERADRDLCLHAGESGAEAEVHTATEGEVLAGVDAPEVELRRGRPEVVLVTIGRREGEHGEAARFDR